ncbi:lipocalin family protein [Agriterribacter sp.]|uniref:lipocalin family protein n=1 Tax=Agriterribacter sp. TaxID=2821509 RepID=UPI002BD24522|nr:lipocalin family protein [Agriterribacter sp.]HTN07989.1 lipocalin family protein [Agriterribacter sp.]
MKHSLLFGKYALLLLLFSTFAFSSCQKDKGDEAKEPTKKELLSNKWKVSDVKNSGGTSVIDFPVPQIVCLKDNIFTLKADNTYTIDEGAVTCDPSSASSGTWSLTSNDTKIQFTPSTGDPLTFDLIDVNATTLKIAYAITDSDFPGADGTYTIILVKA